MTHDGARLQVAREGYESGARKSSCVSGKRTARRFRGVQRIGLQRVGPHLFGHSEGSRDQRGCYAPFSITDAHIEAGERPNGKFIRTLEPPLAIEPRQHITRCELAPPHRDVTVKGDQSGNLAESGLIGLARPFTIGRTNAPIHAPASVAWTVGVE